MGVRFTLKLCVCLLFSERSDSAMRESRERQASTPTSHNESQSQSLTDTEDKPSGDSHLCPYCNYSSNSEMRIQAHILAQHSQNERPPSPASSPARDFLCPLCQDGFKDRTQLEKHVMQIHSVNSEGLQRLLMLVDQSHWLNNSARSSSRHTPPGQHMSPSSVASSSGSKEHDKSNHMEGSREDEKEEAQNMSLDDQHEDENKCPTCQKTFKNIDELCTHQNETGHLEIKQTPSGPGYLCWKKGCNQYFQTAHSLQMHFREIHARGGNATPNVAVSEKHVYKYRCSQCSLAFKTMEKLQLHSQYHLIRDATKCVFCGRSFRSILALHKHVETSHTDLSEEELMAYKQSLMNNPLLLAGISGQILDPSTNELLKRESMKMDDDAMEVDDSPGKDNQEESTTQGGDGDNSDDSIVYKEQQFLEDYLNSQTVAEDYYNDPNRKYKCHRCKVAFTRQSYLTSHNKTLLHRKGEKLSYPMEKYLDPNRPYKCDVCKESFTQKNILLVHYNSVSHLHKLKRAMQEQQQQNNNNNPAVSPQTAASVAAAALAATLGVAPGQLTPKSSSAMDEDDKKPYKCNICKVAYSQGSTLDIHMRSVLHQTRASKLQDLAITGQIDLSKPLIEQPEPQKAQDQHKKLIQDILGASAKNALLTSPPSSGSSGSQVSGSSPGSGSAVPSTISTTPNLTSVPTSIANSSNSPSSVIPSPNPQGMVSCQRCSALFNNQDQLTTHQQLYCMFGSPMTMFPPLPTAPSSGSALGQSLSSPSTKTPPPGQEDSFPRITIPSKKSSQMYKHLLESFGFDLVMQFNENHQRRQRKEREESEKLSAEISSTTPTVTEEPPTPAPVKMETEQLEAPPPEPEVEIKEEEEPPTVDLPEVAKSTCQHCNKEFSSVWVLKAHCEEVHRDLVPLDFLEKYAQQFKCEYEKKSVPTSSTSATNTTVTSTTTSGSDVTPEKDEDNKEAIHAKIGLNTTQSTPPDNTAPSTPTASSTPASSTDSLPANLNNTIAAVAAGMGGANQSNASNLSMSIAQQMNEMQAALNVMAASQLQQQLQQFNPMMMGMAAGLGMGLPLGLNMPALAAMNLQPPLVPMMMPPPPFDPMVGLGQGFNPQGAGMDTAALIAKQQQHLMQQQQQAVSYLILFILLNYV